MNKQIAALLSFLGLGSLIPLIRLYFELKALQRDLTIMQYALAVINFILNPPSLRDILAPYILPTGMIIGAGILIFLYWDRIEPVLSWLWERILEPLITIVVVIVGAILYIPLAIILIPLNYLEEKFMDAVTFFVDVFHQ